MNSHSIEPRRRIYLKGYRFLSFVRNLSNKRGKQLLNNTIKTGLIALKTVSKKQCRKQREQQENSEETKSLTKLGNQKLYLLRMQEILKTFHQVVKSYSKLLKDSTVPKFVTRKWIEINDLSGDQYSDNKNIRFKTIMLRSDFCDYSDAYIVVKRTIDLGVNGDNAMT